MPPLARVRGPATPTHLLGSPQRSPVCDELGGAGCTERSDAGGNGRGSGEEPRFNGWQTAQNRARMSESQFTVDVNGTTFATGSMSLAEFNRFRWAAHTEWTAWPAG